MTILPAVDLIHAVVYCNLKTKILAETFLGLQVGIFVCQNFGIEIAVHDSIANTGNNTKNDNITCCGPDTCCRVLQSQFQNFGKRFFLFGYPNFPLPKFWN